MAEQDSLFETEPRFDKQALAKKLRALLAKNIFIGASSWRYEGWLGQLYTPQRYLTRGRFSKSRFLAECIQEYAEVFPVIGGDFSFYSIPDEAFWNKVFANAPLHLKWNLKAPEEFTAHSFSHLPRYGDRAGQRNSLFLDAEAFKTAFLGPLTRYLERIGAVFIEFGTFSNAVYPEPRQFADDLDAFLRLLPRGLRYAVEIRNDEFLDAAYFDVLKAHGVAHILASWSRMPGLGQQLKIDGVFSAPFTAVRALVKPGRPYAQAVAMFKPYRQVQDPYPSGREALKEVIRRAQQRAISAYLHINNRLEGNAVETIEAITDD